MAFKFGKRSLKNLEGVHTHMIALATRALALSKIDFAITDGRRTIAEQAEFVRLGKSKTMKSRHLAGHAIDVVACFGKEISYAAVHYHEIKDAFKKASEELKIPFRWGGDWDCDGDSEDEKFFDGPHFELPARQYP